MKTKKDYNIIGYEVVDSKIKLFDIMLQSLADFTMPKSTCHLIYIKSEGYALVKSYYKHSTKPYYINGDCYKS